ncbi:uncharacterized protein V1510DRAFT_432330 [Dipodascopsis tothii]|uniref:uncharacterized protein n=1 Tax=Dipodascopsis tothii TaxID=44089 RepID=UPI0034D01F25
MTEPLGAHHRSDSFDLLSPTQSLTGSLRGSGDAGASDAAVFSDDSASRTNGPEIAGDSPGKTRRAIFLQGGSGSLNRNITEWQYRYTPSVSDGDGSDSDDEDADLYRVSSNLAESLRVAHYRKYIFASVALVVALATFVIQTEAARYLSQELGYRKPMFMLYCTHSSYVILVPLQIVFMWLTQRRKSLAAVRRSYAKTIKSTLNLICITNNARESPLQYLVAKTAAVTVALTVAGSTWYIAVNLTTPGDVTAIYNCSAFFAYVFSVLILGEKVRARKVVSVLIAIVGVLVVAYGDELAEALPAVPGGMFGHGEREQPMDTPQNRVLGNAVIGFGAIMYGLYEALYKWLACPPSSCPPRRSVYFATFFTSCIGLFTLVVLWVMIPVIHVLDIERFEAPTGAAFWTLLVSILANVLFSGSFLTLISLTSPVLSSVAALLTIFLVALSDNLLFGTPLTLGAVVGGIVIIIAFLLLSYESWQELNEEKADFLHTEASSARPPPLAAGL